ncbi:MAG: hypothetical protein ACOCT0_01185 [Halobacteriota archaeon]
MTRVWLVERDYSEEVRNMLELVYATADGRRRLHMQKMVSTPSEADSVTAARDVEDERLETVDDPELRRRYRCEVERMRERHEPDDVV